MDGLLQDLRYALRLLVRAPAVTLPILAALALGIGANTAMFSVIDAVLLRPLVYSDPSHLVLLWEKDANQTIFPVAGANFLDFRAESTSFSQMAGWIPQGFVLTGGDRPEQLRGGAVTANFFATLGVKPALGRPFLPDEDGLLKPEAYSRVVILSDRLWREQFGSDLNILGRMIRLNDQQFAVVGVMPPDFQFINRRHSLWVPVRFEAGNRTFHNLTTVARLREGVGVPAATQECMAIARRLAERYPGTNRSWTVRIDLLQDWLGLNGKDFRTTLYMLGGAVMLVLLIACGNVASLLLARAVSRRREIAIRAALGAGRWRVIRQLLTESTLLSVLGGLLGLLFAVWLLRISRSILPPNSIPPTVPIRISSAVLWFTTAVSVLTGVLFGLAPALEASKVDAHATLRDGGRGSTGGRRAGRLRSGLVVIEVALATVLLAGSALMLQSLNKLTSVELGFRPQKVLSFSVFLPISKYPEPDRVLSFYNRMTEKIRSLPGVESVSTASHLPLQPMTHTIPFELDIDTVHEEGERPGIYYVTLDSGYLQTLGVALKDGRGFAPTDTASGAPVVLVNQAFADRYYKNQRTVGRFLRINRPILGKNGFEPTVRAEIVGVTANVKLDRLSSEAEPTIYIPFAQNIWNSSTMVAVRTSQNPEALVAAIRREVQSLDKDQPIDRVATMEDTFDSFFAGPRFRTVLMSAFAGVALLLAILGIYSVNAYAVSQRRNEFGVRMALGASPEQILRMALTTALWQTVIGAAIGVAASIGLASVLRTLLFGVTPTDPVTLAAVVAILAVVALIAGLAPAIRASRIAPAIALRQG
ncbi:MAG: ABC transporter permease [Bryobacteraceae bacterium]